MKNSENTMKAPEKAPEYAVGDCTRWKKESNCMKERSFTAGEVIPDGWMEDKFMAGTPRDPVEKAAFMEKFPIIKVN